VAGVGVPGTPGFQARLDLVALALGQPLATGLWALSLVSIAYYGRLAIVGLRRPSVAVRSGADPIPRWPSPRRSGSRADVVADTTALLRANRAPIAAGLVLVLSGLAVTLAVGGLGVRAAAAGARPSPAFEISSSVGEVASPAP
jgi:hypothetical protein